MKSEIITQEPPKVTAEFPSYAWADSKKSIKIYIDYEFALSVHDDDLILESSEKFVKLTVRTSQKDLVLLIPELNEAIVSASVLKKESRFILTLKKEKEFSWYKLAKSS